MRTERLYGDKPYPTRLPMPRFELDFGQPIEWQEARLHLQTATAEINGKLFGQPVHAELYVDVNENVVVIRLTGPSIAKVQPRLTLDHLDANAKATLKKWGYPDPVTTTGDNEGTLSLDTPSGYKYAAAWKRAAVAGKDECVIRVAVLSTADAPNPLDASRELAAKISTDATAHQAWWAEYWTRSYLTIPDARLESLYYIEMYKLGCSSRPGKYPATLQGLWTLDGGMPPWSGDYHLDMNVQQTYWPIYTANRLDLGEPLYRVFSACLPRWQKQCKDFFGFDGIWAGCAIGPKGERIFGYSGVELWPGNVAWLAHHYWLHFLYSQDKEFLQDQALPIIRPAFLTYANLLEEGDDKKLHVPLSYSPEWGEGSFKAYCKDPNCDLALIRFLGKAILKSNEALGETDPLTDRVKDVLARLTDYVEAGDHLLISAGTPPSDSHRHHSHLMAIHPLGLLTLDGTDKEKNLIRNSLYEIRVKGTGAWTGWAFPWMSLIASRAGYGNMAWNMLNLYADGFITPNTFHINGDPRIFGASLFEYEPMTLEAGFGAAAGIMEMLLQSYNGTIRVFPSIPDRWHDAYFAGLRAEGAFLVTAKLEKGTVSFVKIMSEAGIPCHIKNPFGEGAVELTSSDSSSQAPRTLSGKLLEFDTASGKTYLLYPAGRKPSEDGTKPVPFARTELDTNFFGLKRLPRF